MHKQALACDDPIVPTSKGLTNGEGRRGRGDDNVADPITVDLALRGAERTTDQSEQLGIGKTKSRANAPQDPYGERQQQRRQRLTGR